MTKILSTDDNIGAINDYLTVVACTIASQTMWFTELLIITTTSRQHLITYFSKNSFYCWKK